MFMAVKILIADQSGFIREKLRKLFEDQGYRVIEAASGKEAVQAYQKEKPDVVIMDILLPEKDGITVLKELQQDGEAPRVIFLSAQAQKELVLQAAQLGAKKFLVKPYEDKRMLMAVREVLIA